MMNNGGSLSVLCILVVIFVAAMILAVLKKKGLSLQRADFRYKQTPVMTENEMKLFGRLIQELPNYYIFPQVSMGAILKPQSTNGQKEHLAAFRAISQKRIDYVICDQTLSIKCLLELDDTTHRQKRDDARDQITGTAGLKTIRVRSGKVVDLAPLHRWLGEQQPDALGHSPAH